MHSIVTFHQKMNGFLLDRNMIKQLNKIFMRLTLAIVLIALCSVTCTTSERPTDKATKRTELIREIVKQYHYKKLKINDDFSVAVFDEYTERLDYNKRFFTQKEISKLKKYRLTIDNQYKANENAFFDLSYQLITSQIKRVEGYYKDILAKPFNFTRDETIQLDAEKLDYVKSNTDLKERWRKNLKYQILTRVHNKLIEQEKRAKESDTVTIKTIAELESNAREKVLKDHNQWFKRMKRLTKEERFTDYLNSIIAIYDPHTTFFPPKDKENFDIRISGSLEGIGATLQEENGYIKVTRIVPGSASYRQGELEAEDVILKVGQATEDPVDIVDMRLDDAVQLIRGPKGSEVRLTVRKKSGEEKVIPIIRDVVILQETFAKSAIVKDSIQDGKKYGYIKLPSFYADFRGKGGRNCSEDILAEIEKLKIDSVEGIIFDLRDNGGGSLQDVITMSGFFINKGPIVQVQDFNRKTQIYPDYDESIHYDGPLVVLVNSFSASASEIFAAAMQDYNRAIIMGTKSSYGKGTVQGFVNLDDYVRNDSIKPLGELKITRSKFYRINGGATQWKGVEPDIVFPDNYSYLELGEKELNHSMEWDTISPANYDKWRLRNKNDIVLNSKRRITNDSIFTLVEENARRFKKLRDKTVVNLNLEQFKKNKAAEKEGGKKYENLFTKIPELTISTSLVDQRLIEADSTKAPTYEQLSKNLKKDRYLLEAIHVIGEMK